MPGPEITAAIIAGSAALAGGTATAVASGKTNKKSYKYNSKLQEDAQQHAIEMQDRTFGYQKELNDMAYQQNLEQWNRENAYNSPSAQMERYKEAGLNPNLIYSQNNTSAHSPQYIGGSAPSGSTPVVGAPNIKAVNFDYIANSIGQGLSTYQNILNNKQQRNQSQAYINLMNQEADNLNNRTNTDMMLFPHRLKEIQQNYINAQTQGLGYQVDVDRKIMERDVARRIFGYDDNNKFVDSNSLHAKKVAFEKAQMEFGGDQMKFIRELNEMSTFTQREMMDIFNKIKENPSLIDSEEINARIRMLQMFGANINTEADLTWDRWLDRGGKIIDGVTDVVGGVMDVYTGGKSGQVFDIIEEVIPGKRKGEYTKQKYHVPRTVK